MRMSSRFNNYPIYIWTIAILGAICIVILNSITEDRGISALSGDSAVLIDTNEIETQNILKGPLPPELYKININTATAEELIAIPGVGKTIAARIVDYRKSTPFTKLEDLAFVKGITEKSLPEISEFAHCD